MVSGLLGPFRGSISLPRFVALAEGAGWVKALGDDSPGLFSCHGAIISHRREGHAGGAGRLASLNQKSQGCALVHGPPLGQAGQPLPLIGGHGKAKLHPTGAAHGGHTGFLLGVGHKKRPARRPAAHILGLSPRAFPAIIATHRNGGIGCLRLVKVRERATCQGWQLADFDAFSPSSPTNVTTSSLFVNPPAQPPSATAVQPSRAISFR